ncbi:MAG: hypothetical protein Q7T32_11750 [Moraxellaceae bacterium]|nr:hypothetical protein [Moraxellaceae bacterium]
MQRSFTGLVLATLFLAGCASAPGPQGTGLYHAPARAYSLALDSGVFRGPLTMTEKCDARGGTLNMWDATNRFFRIDYLKVNQHPVATIPNFANERTIDELVLNNYQREVLSKAAGVAHNEILLSEFVDTGRGDAMFSVASIDMKPEALPEQLSATTYYYGFLVFTRGDFVYVLQHRFDAYQPDKMKNLLSALRQDMLVPGLLRHNESAVKAAQGVPEEPAAPGSC